jgi:acetyl-CoA carboxylase carboxyl transferase subunit beta
LYFPVHRMPAEARFLMMFDGGEFEKLDAPTAAIDPLKFRDEKRYVDRLKDAKSKSGVEDSVQAGYGRVNEQFMVVAIQDMGFIGGSLGMAAGDAIIAAMRFAVSKRCPFVMFVASGGARMQEGILSLMQMPRTTIAVQELRAAKLPYIVVLTNPTTGGVTASYAMLGDVHLAEPNAIIGFAGQRVIEQTIREKLPEGFQRSEYLKDHGMVDTVVHRHEMKSTVSRIARMLTKSEAREHEVGALVPA